jgi:UDP-glucose 4-epimerase
LAKGKVLATGGAGFIGSHVVDLYLSSGYSVVVVDDLSSGKESNLNKDVKLYKVDIGSPDLETVFAKEKPDWVNHHAAQISVSRSVRDPAGDAEINVVGSLNLLENAVKHNVKKFIFASSGGTVYGVAPNWPATEEMPLSPLSPYGVAKVAFEFYLRYYKSQRGLDYVALRYSNVYGPRQDPHGEAGVVAIFSQAMLSESRPQINARREVGDDGTIRDFVYCRDVALANLLATESTLTGAYNVGTGVGTTIREMYEIIAEEAGFKGQPVYGPRREGDLEVSILSPAKIKKELGWEPNVPLKEGIRETVDFFRRSVISS